MRRAIKSAVEAALVLSGTTAIARRRNPERIAVLAYHNIVVPGDAGRGDASLHLPLPEFLAQIDLLRQTHEIVALDRVGEPRTTRRPRAVITFDDAYRGAVRLAFPELHKRGVPATVFVAPALLGTSVTWWDELGELGLLEQTRDRALVEHAGRTDAVRAALTGGRPTPTLPDSYAIASLDELLDGCDENIAVGSHSWGHEYLPALEDEELDESLRAAAEWVRRYPGARSEWLALPYGAGSREQAQRALQAGHAGVLRIDGGVWAGGSTDRVPRINVPSKLSVRGLELRTSGLLRR